MILFCLFTSKCIATYVIKLWLKYMDNPLYNMGWEWHVLLVFFLVYVPGRLAACSLVGGQDFCKIIRIHNYKNGIVFYMYIIPYTCKGCHKIFFYCFFLVKNQKGKRGMKKGRFQNKYIILKIEKNIQRKGEKKLIESKVNN